MTERTPPDLSARLGALSPEKQALLARKLAERAAGRDATAPTTAHAIPRRADPSAPAPLTHAQELLWLHEQMTPNTATYNVPMARRVDGPLDLDALRRAFDAVVARHEALRTRIVEIDGAPRQVVGDAPYAFDIVDLRAASSTDAAARVLRDAAAAPFDLATGPLLRVVVIRERDDRHVLLVVAHHVVFDGGSIGVLFRDLAAAYDAARGGAAPTLPPLAIQLADVATWERAALDDDRLAEAVRFWRAYLDGAPTRVDLPTDVPRTRATSGPGARAARMLPPALRDRVRRLAQEHGATSFMVLLAAFQTLLHRYSGQRDVVVGSPIAGRTRAETQPLIANLASTLVLRARFDDDAATFATLLADVRRGCLGAYDHQALPYERLVRLLRDERGSDDTGLFDVLFVLQDAAPAGAPSAVGTLGAAALEPLALDVGAAKFDVTLSLIDGPDGLRATLEYRTDLFDAATIDGLLRHFETLLAAACACPDAPLATLPLLPPAERAGLLASLCGPALAYDGTASMASLFAAQAARTPAAPALVAGARVLTYAELDVRSARLARHLRSLGVGAGTLVAICATRTPDLVVGLLAILRAGGAYVPLDPAYPAERLATIIEDAGASVVVTESACIAALPLLRTPAARVVLLDAALPPLAAAAALDAAALDAAALDTAAPGDLAYVIYTSGSTGRPKGVAIEHRSAVAFIAWARTVFAAEDLAGVLASTSVCFDLSVFELFVTLAAGGTVILAENALHLPDLLPALPVTLVNTVPSAIAALLRIGALPSSVRTVNLAGEPLAQEVVDALYALPHVGRVYDLYGPSEDTTYSTFVLRTAAGRASIGRPIANTQAYVVDAAMQLVPLGVPGELYLGGAGLARGYLGQPGLTAERFVPNPFAAERALPADDRIYRTGDLVRWTRAGVLEYLGRLDHQVKLRGFRIELGEVEAALRAQPGVGAAVAVVRDDVPGERLLVAYVAPTAGAAPPPRAELLAALRTRLPEYMVPSAIVELPQLPMTPNGKVDRKALPTPDASASDVASAFVAPRDALETVIAHVWREVLGRERVGAETSFFDLGGHSLLATRIAGQLTKIFRTSLPLRRFFEAPTVAGIARTLAELEAKPGQATAIARLFQQVQQMTPAERERLRLAKAGAAPAPGAT